MRGEIARFGRECLNLLRLGVPVFLAQISMVGMGFVDIVMTGRYGTEDMAAIAVAGSIWMPLLLFCHGMLLPVLSGVARKTGRGIRAGMIFNQGLWLAVFLAVPICMALYGLSFCLEMFGVTPDVAAPGGRYLRFLVMGVPAFLLYAVLSYGLEGLSLTKPVMYAGCAGLACNILGNWIFIYGHCGISKLGGAGAGLATACVYLVMFSFLAAYILQRSSVRNALDAGCLKKPCRKILRSLAGIGFPGALGLLFETILFDLSAIFVAPLGAVAVAGHQIGINVVSMVFMIFVSLSTAVNIRVSHSIGAGDPKSVRRSTRTALFAALAGSVCVMIVFLLLRKNIVSLYTENEEVMELAALLLGYAALYEFADSLQCVSMGILRGYNDTAVASRIAFLAYMIVALPLGFILGRTSWLTDVPMGVPGFWLSFIFGLIIAAFLYLRRILFLERTLPVHHHDEG
ncbi:MAG: MATE family efflux transporter [Desulfovibrionaceae bacterium]|nr:MATE family efflux transporter [Desulfovibrionaceae bacterium]